ncbi:hypothetical protein F7725_018251 [Dissostichus mawsoni]|uniref:Uncharacterized protein n=1 Tax=Dissostichus mawsoni TaxID=36200 RepID=A0A7J5XR03_DISMA|nr:hypothetical protein F7725_018251 [Dissostichus mawsoni]
MQYSYWSSRRRLAALSLTGPTCPTCLQEAPPNQLLPRHSLTGAPPPQHNNLDTLSMSCSNKPAFYHLR